MSVNGAGTGNGRGTTANRAVTAVIDGVGHRRLELAAARQEIQNSATRSALVPSGTASERPSSVRRQLASNDSHVDDNDGSTREPPLRRQRQVLQRCCDCSRSSTCALSGLRLALLLVPAELRTSAALRAAALTTVRTSARRYRLRHPRHSDASSPVLAQLLPQNPPQQPIQLQQPPLRPRPSPSQRLP